VENKMGRQGQNAQYLHLLETEIEGTQQFDRDYLGAVGDGDE
jgi:hypothetical protein